MSKIYHIRGKKVMLDRDFSELHGIETRVLKQTVRRNINRFPSDFMFKMSAEELEQEKQHKTVQQNRNKIGFKG